jgi:hypothetical protein
VWSAVLATTDLALVSKMASFMVGGLETIVEFWARLWISRSSRSIYIATELPQSPLKYKSPTLCRPNYQEPTHDSDNAMVVFKHPRWF